MKVTPKLSGVLFLLIFNASLSAETHPVSLELVAPPFKSRNVDLLEYVGEPSVTRHRVIPIDVSKLIEVLQTAGSHEADEETQGVIFTLFDDVSFSVHFTSVSKFGMGWNADFVGTETTQDPDNEERVSGNLTIQTRTNELMSSFHWKHRIFAIHFTEDSPYHLVVDNDPEHMPAMD